MFDVAARISRKNPFGAIAAFKRAFGDRPDVRFTLKISPAPGFEPDVQRLVCEVSRDARMVLINQALDLAGIQELYRTHDIYLSLHRAEGFGLTIREAMQHGLQVVATGWSGNVDFMHGPRVHSISYRLIPVLEDQEIFAVPQATWADPDIEHAAGTLREIDRACRAGEEPRVARDILRDGGH